MFTDADVKRYARHITGHITGHLDSTPDEQHLAATRAILNDLASDGRLLPRTSRMATFTPGSPGRSPHVVIHLSGSREIVRFMTNLLNHHLEIAAAASAVLIDLREHMTPEVFDPMARAMLGADRHRMVRDRLERDWSCKGCDDDIQIGANYAPTEDGGSICGNCCRGYPMFESKMRPRPAPHTNVDDLGGFVDYYGVRVCAIGEDGDLIALGHHPPRRILAAFNRYAREVWGLASLVDGGEPPRPDEIKTTWMVNTTGSHQEWDLRESTPGQPGAFAVTYYSTSPGWSLPQLQRVST